MRVITFSRYFPKGHPNAGQHTFFVEQILNGIAEKMPSGIVELNRLNEAVRGIVNDFALLCNRDEIKHHTIRAGNRWKVGDKFSARVWSGKPYASKQIEFAQLEIKKTWEFELKQDGDYRFDTCNYGSFCKESRELKEISKNDGLEISDFIYWFTKPFTGQIICWNENINY